MDEKILDEITYIGYLLLRYGAEVYRVEQSLTKMSEGMSFTNIEVYAIPSYFTISLDNQEGKKYCATKRSIVHHVNYDKLYALNDLVREISKGTLDVDEIHQRVEEVLSIRLNYILILVGYMMSAIFFTLFFGGLLPDLVVSAIIGVVLYYVILILENLQINSLLRTIIGSQVIALIAVVFYHLGFTTSYEYSIIGSLMILTPGVAITNSLRDIIQGDYVSGLARMTEAFLIATSIAIGVGSIVFIGG